MKSWLQSKVIWFNVLSFIAAAFELTDVIDVVPPAYNGAMAAVVSIVNLALRFITSGPVMMATPNRVRALYGNDGR